jgi:predicted ATPase/DNA-binding CsgD family transcriptional regulator
MSRHSSRDRSEQPGAYESTDTTADNCSLTTSHLPQSLSPSPSVTFRVVPALAEHHQTAQVPAQPTPIIGRDADIASLVHTLSNADVRLVTLTGPGGVGKTRLACEVAVAIADLIDAVYYVDLTAVESADDVLPTIAEAVGLPDIATRSAVARLADALQGQRVLVVLDNFENVISAAQKIADLLTRCSTLSLLITSRVALRLRWEYLIQVAPLPVPSSNRPLSVEALGRVPSVALFVERVHSVKPEFALTAANARVVAEICERLEGLPLALELAAMHMRRLSAEGLLGRLGDPLQLLLNGPRDLPPRQQSLRATMDASYALLNAPEQWLARRLAVFHGGGSLAAIAEVAAADGEAPSDGIQDSLELLAEHSVIHIHEPVPGELRFTMLDITRLYLLEHLRKHDEYEEAQTRAVAYFASLVEQVAPDLGRAGSGDALTRLERDDDNLQAVLQWSLEQHRPDLGLSLASQLWRYWDQTGRLATGRYWLAELLREDAAPSSARTRLAGLAAAGFLAARSGDYQQAAELLEQAQAIWDTSVGDAVRAELFAELGHVRVCQGQYDDATALLNGALSMLEDGEAPLVRARALSASAHLALERDESGVARALLGECYALVAGRSIECVVDVLCQHAELALLTGNAMDAQERLEEALSLARAERYRAAQSRALIGLADVAVAQHRPEDARCAYREALLLIETDSSWDRLIAVLEGAAALAAITNRIEGLDWLVGQAELLRQRTGAAASTMRGAWVERRLSGMRQPGERTVPGVGRPLKISTGFDEVTRQALYVLDHLPPSFSNRDVDLGTRGSTAVLSSREREVARYISDGFTNRQIAANLRIAERTVDSHVGNILRKLELSSRTQIAAWEIRQALLTSPDPSLPSSSADVCSHS